MTTLMDEDLLSTARNLKGRVVLITGGGNGVGREASILFAKYGARVVIGDVDVKGGNWARQECEKVGKLLGGGAIFKRCDVSSWEEQVALFTAAVETYWRIDCVVINAGMNTLLALHIILMSSRRYGFFTPMYRYTNPPAKPKLGILDVNLVGAIYTAGLAQHYLLQNEGPRGSIIFVGSMTSFNPVGKVEIYTASKHGLLAFHDSLHHVLAEQGIHSAIICPHVMNTGVLDVSSLLGVAGVPLTPVPRVAKTILHAASEQETRSDSGAIYVLPDAGPALRVACGELDNIHEVVKERVERMIV
ncbi:hypothetical protein M408DRAFT_79215 [Serendipita vermifera MAFF 305830]|uniref:Uncharacterized protein n=1 Tax=Serendipita vermifera MAFF 305830 TaxID=933852 RepID=A0A0C3ACF9_SERVB|nr:hypothetical protein M408DRAFT_79215 [Serendipita vermifera MAFF 305830]